MGGDMTPRFAMTIALHLLAMMLIACTAGNGEARQHIEPVRSYYVRGMLTEIVEFVPPGAPHMLCVAVASKGGVSCFPRNADEAHQ